MRRLIVLSCFAVFVTPLSVTSIRAQETVAEAAHATEDGPEWMEPYRADAVKRWEKSIAELEALDASESDPSEAILFVGSSSVRRWDDIAIDMAPYHTIRRGYGGAKYSDLVIFAKRLILPHQYRALVIFVGNDVTGKETDRTPDELEQLVNYVVDISHDHRPGAPVFLIEITPTESRFKAWEQVRAANARLRDFALRTPNTYFIATAEHFLRPDGSPRSELFVEDKLHLNEQGYDLWSTLIRRQLDDVFRLIAETELASPDVTTENQNPEN